MSHAVPALGGVLDLVLGQIEVLVRLLLGIARVLDALLGEGERRVVFGGSAGVLRLTENTSVSLDKLTLTDTGADTAVDVQLGLTEGSILGNVNKLSAASRYEIKTPNGVAGIRGTRFRMSSNSFIVLMDGTLVYVYVPPGGNPTPYTLAGPPAVYFSPPDGVKPAPDDLVREVRGQFGPPFTPPGPPPARGQLPKLTG